MICVYCKRIYGEVSTPLDSHGCCKECEVIVEQELKKLLEREGKDEND